MIFRRKLLKIESILARYFLFVVSIFSMNDIISYFNIIIFIYLFFNRI